MPELPEVETMVRDLAPRVTGHSIASVEASFPGIVTRPPTFAEFSRRIVGATITGIDRRGKYALFNLDTGDTLVIHRGMTGSLFYRRATDPMEPYVRIVLRLGDGAELRLNDPRKFGKVMVLSGSEGEPPVPWATMGPEPLEAGFTPAILQRRLRGRTAQIKPLLLNQQVLAGLGNIYVDEALHLARIHPRRPAGNLTSAEVRRLHSAIRAVLDDAVENRGTTFSSYADVEGRAGRYQRQLRVFRKAGAPCPRCRTPIQRLVVGARGTHICPRCQKLP